MINVYIILAISKHLSISYFQFFDSKSDSMFIISSFTMYEVQCISRIDIYDRLRCDACWVGSNRASLFT